ncbi:MAG: hypothetical protein IPK99_02365 [Flavobacteriales bacterium]|nr:hypothetical protein [Flavobacteriales bacterium]
MGIFAANGSNSGRVTAGATYYGIMEMGGNLWERVVTIGLPEGRVYTGTHGNGILAATGDPNATTWPLATTAEGAGSRGGDYTFSALSLRTSDRVQGGNVDDTRQEYRGGRGVRQAP